MLLNAMPPFSSFISVKPTTINPSSLTPITYNYISSHLPPKLFRIHSKLPSFNHSTLQISHKLHCILHGQELSSETLVAESDISDDKDEQSSSVLQEKIELVEPTSGNNSNQSLWDQMIEIIKFSGPATGLWICGPLMSLIDTAVIGQGSSIELAALGPGTVLCDYMSYVFMFLSIATSNMVATSLARQDEEQVQHQISILLFLGLACGVLMLGFTKIFGAWALSAFAGAKNVHLIPAADTYVQIRALAWPAILVGWVAQSASLGMKDSMGPLKALVIASVINGVGDIVLCMFLGYGIAGAAWATAVSQIVAAYTMIDALNKKGYNGFSIEIPTPAELQEILTIAAPVFITIVSKVGFYSLIIYFATSIGTQTIAAHQVLTQIFHMCAVWGEPLSQTAQSFMPELLYGVNRSLVKARDLLKSLLIIGGSVGLVLGIVATSVPFLAPSVFTPDRAVIAEMHKVWVPFFLSLCVTPCILSCEGSLLAGRDLKFISSSMSACFALGTLVLLLVRSQGLGLVGCWCALVGFQWARFFLALQRLLSRNGILFSEDLERYRLSELKTA
ncbi:protein DETOXIFICATION 46, chloroplastic isoform X1 [Amaranthus tricolor]|uniref:protein DETOXIFICATION 46, chloroplastic isoform X1 n=1 Tax=Amaranthus tricolor TaxID=29722 RepID=UPI00258686B5|nr:protein DETOXIFICATION 46, chloroplastic isoform X1 [Amaranthus tricolor]